MAEALGGEWKETPDAWCRDYTAHVRGSVRKTPIYTGCHPWIILADLHRGIHYEPGNGWRLADGSESKGGIEGAQHDCDAMMERHPWESTSEPLRPA